MAYLQRKNIKRKRTCYACSEPCVTSYIYCEECCCFSHVHCEKISGTKVKNLEKLPPDFPYICRKCRCDENVDFDFNLAQQRLQKAATNCFKKLQSCVKRELLFLDSSQLTDQHEGNVNLLVDLEAQELLHKYLTNDNGVPATISAKDNQLFRAVSVAFCARESLASELRVRCCIEMVEYEKYYRYQKNHEKIERCAPSYVDSCIDCAIVEEGSSAWTISALASVVKRRITSVYPRVNGPADPACQALNTTFEPREKPFCEQTYRILWCSHGTDLTRGRWKPNTFVPLFDSPKSQEEQNGEDSMQQADDDVEMESVEGSGLESIPDADVDPMETASVTSAASVTPSLKEEMLTEKAQLEVAEGGLPLPDNKFMDTYEVYDKIVSATQVKSDIPRGVKENVYFLLDNSHNMNHPERRSSFYDDCGVWNSHKGSVAKTYFLLEENGVLGSSLKIVDGKFAVQIKKEGVNPAWTVLEPQPDPDKLVICHKHYCFHKLDKEYRRRITWFTVPPGFRGGNVAIAEYTGTFPGYPKTWQGKPASSEPKTPYKRTDPQMMEKIADLIKESAELTPAELLHKVQAQFGSECPVRDKKQIANIKYHVVKKMKQDGVDIPKREKSLVTQTKSPAGRPKVIVQMNPGEVGTQRMQSILPRSFIGGKQGATNVVQIRDKDKVQYVTVQVAPPAKSRGGQQRQEFVQVVSGPQPKFELQGGEELEEAEVSSAHLQSLLGNQPDAPPQIDVHPSEHGYTVQMRHGRVETPQTPHVETPQQQIIVKVEEEAEPAVTQQSDPVVESIVTQDMQQMHLLQIQDGDQTKLLQIPAGLEVKVLEMEDGQQALSVVRVDARGVLDPSTEAVYMIHDLLNSSTHGLGQEMTFI